MSRYAARSFAAPPDHSMKFCGIIGGISSSDRVQHLLVYGVSRQSLTRYVLLNVIAMALLPDSFTA